MKYYTNTIFDFHGSENLGWGFLDYNNFNVENGRSMSPWNISKNTYETLYSDDCMHTTDTELIYHTFLCYQSNTQRFKIYWCLGSFHAGLWRTHLLHCSTLQLSATSVSTDGCIKIKIWDLF
jgi:hypothetical protein